MGERLGQMDGYPAGVSNSDPHFHEDDVPCLCDHMPVDHVDEDGECEICTHCPSYQPVED